MVLAPGHAKVPGPSPDAASGNTTSPYCRAVSAYFWLTDNEVDIIKVNLLLIDLK